MICKLIRIFNILKHTEAEGPGVRYCIWVQGCEHHCIGCQAIHTWSKFAGKIMSVDSILEDILNQKDIEGVTFLGGEPFEQAEALGIIAEKVQKNGLSVLCFTGGYIENLQREDKNKKLLSNIDLLIDGPFEIDKVDYSRPWCGSSNQRYHFLSDRYNDEIFSIYKNKVELNISKDGTLFMNGMGNFQQITKKLGLISLQKK